MMFRRRHSREVPVLNTTSTADISFMLLIFFLVTTNMDKDTGLQRMLPAADRQKEQQLSVVDKSKTLTLQLQKGGALLADGKPLPMAQVRKTVARFVAAKGTGHLLSLTCSPDADYDSYFHLQNEIMLAYRAVRDAEALRRFHKRYNQLSPAPRKAIQDLMPVRIAEPYDNSPSPENHFTSDKH